MAKRFWTMSRHLSQAYLKKSKWAIKMLGDESEAVKPNSDNDNDDAEEGGEEEDDDDKDAEVSPEEEDPPSPATKKKPAAATPAPPPQQCHIDLYGGCLHRIPILIWF